MEDLAFRVTREERTLRLAGELDMATVPRPAPRMPPQALAPQLIAAIQERVARGEQSLLFLNRRGFAPVLHCPACTWKSGCPHCSARTSS